MLDVIRDILDEFDYDCIRSDSLTKGGIITTQIIEMLLKADLVIADLTGNNANVFYELGIRHATNKPFIQIINEEQDKDGKKITKIPFDLNQVRTIVYNYDEEHEKMDEKNFADFKDRLCDYVLSCQLRPFEIKNPLSDIDDLIPLKSEEEPTERIMSEIIKIIADGLMLFQPPNIKYSARGMTRESQPAFIKSTNEILRETRDNLIDLRNGVVRCSGPLIGPIFKNFMDHVENEFVAISVDDWDFWMRNDGDAYLQIAENHSKHKEIKLERIFVIKRENIEDDYISKVFEKQINKGVKLRFVYGEDLTPSVIDKVSRLDFGLFDHFAVSFFRATQGRTYTVSTSKYTCQKFR
ncbi:MAG: hypothetical protein SFU99_23960, partial [Saprospiraceae bacterium]|nr:hypothetical protein [Saprospiraceae bacterium]